MTRAPRAGRTPEVDFERAISLARYPRRAAARGHFQDLHWRRSGSFPVAAV